jgi:hypothetical protein
VRDDITGDGAGLLGVSEMTLRQLAEQADESALGQTLRRIIDGAEDGGEIAGWSARL